MDEKLRVGTSGYSYKHWMNGVFYPTGLPPGRWFEYYAERFNTVELNVTFYRMPRAEIFTGWRKRAPKGFLFFVKGSRYITHLKRFADPKPSLKIFWSGVRRLGDALGGVLWQLPPRFHADRARLEAFVEAFAKFPRTRHVFEFREEDWFNRETTALFEKHGIAYCRADRRDYYRTLKIPDTAPFVYVRRHGPETGPAYTDSYSDASVLSDAAAARKWLKKGKMVFFYYNNDGQGAAPRDAVRLIRGIRSPQKRPFLQYKTTPA